VKTLHIAYISPEAIALLQKRWSTKVVVGVVAMASDSCGKDGPTNIIYHEHWGFGVRV
jgi:hypothetical protein